MSVRERVPGVVFDAAGREIFVREAGVGAPALFVHGLGVALLAGRLSHAWGVSQVRENFAFRIFGMAMTLGTLIVCAGFLLWAFVVG